MIFRAEPGTTPLDPDETVGFIPTHIANRDQLNEWELSNIVDGERWAFSRRHAELLSAQFIRDLHRQMFGRTWRWAGEYRLTEKNIGVAPMGIATAVQNLCADVRVQLEFGKPELDEIAARFSHRLVSIHPFANGNGRHARTMADLLLAHHGAARFSWGAADSNQSIDARHRYLQALQSADEGDYEPLLHFVRS
jgi:Fic-DOC domain mobile mystery protein B